MKSRLVIIMICCCTLFAGCGVMRKVALEDSTTISYSDDSSVDVTIVGNNLPIKLKDEELRQFVELIEERVANDCAPGLQILIGMPDMESYADEGYYISIKYSTAKEICMDDDDSTIHVEEIYVLISKENKSDSLIMYRNKDSSKVFSIWKTSYDLILEYLE